MTKTIEDLFFYLIFIADLFVIGQIVLLVKPLKKHTSLLLVLIYCTVNSIFNIIPSFVSAKTVYLSLALFTLLEYALFSLIFLNIIKNKKFKKFGLLLSLFFFITVITIFFTQNKRFDSLPIGIETIIMMIFSFYYLYEQMNDLTDSFIYNRYHFWIAIGILIYLGGSFFIYIFADKVDEHILDDYWFLTYVFYIIKNIFFAIGIANLITKNKKINLSRIKPYNI